MTFNALSASKITDSQETVRRLLCITSSKLTGMPETSRGSQQLEEIVND